MYIFSKFATRKCFYSMILIVDQKCFPKLINVWYGISTYWVEFCSKINKRPQTLIRYSRVLKSISLQGDLKFEETHPI